MATQTKTFSTISGGKIDRAAGIIFGVSVITIGQAKGHGLKIDSKTLSSVCEVASEFSNGVKVKFRHRQDGEHQNVISDTAGVLKNFSVKGKKTIADFHFLKSLSTETKEKICEMAEDMPDQFGFSIHFSGVSETIDGDKFARCEELQSVDLSDNPAANPDGLFSMSDKHKADCDCAECKKLSEKSKKEKTMDDETMSAIATLTEQVKQLAAKLDAKPAPVTMLSIIGDDGKEVQLSAKDIQAQLAASKATSDEAKKNSDTIARQNIIAKMDTQGRVPMNPATSKAYTLAELNVLPLETLQFAAVNSPCIPLEAKAVYHVDEKPKLDPKLKGSELVAAAFSDNYSDLQKMLETPVGHLPN